MIFGKKLRRLREKKGLTQQQLAEMLGYVTNSYISDVEKGRFIPSKGKLKKIAKILGVPFKDIDNLLLDSKIEALGIREPELRERFREVPNLPKENKKIIIKVYLQIKKKKQRKNE